MATQLLLQPLARLVSNLSAEIPTRQRYRRWLGAMRTSIPCDAPALLRQEDGALVQGETGVGKELATRTRARLFRRGSA